MPIMKYSAMDTSGSWRPDAMDQVEQWNAQRGDQWNQFNTSRRDQMSAEDWRKEVALKQLGLQENIWKGGREDAATMRQLEADRFGKQFGYMSERDKLLDARAAAREEAEGSRWQQGFDLQKGGIEDNRRYRQEDRDFELAKYNEGAALRLLQKQNLETQVAEANRKQTTMAEASKGAMYTPSTDTGKQAYQEALAMTGSEMQASQAAKTAERSDAGRVAEAAKGELANAMADFYEKDRSLFSGTTGQERVNIMQKAEALKLLLKQAGLTEPEIAAEIAKLARSNMTDNGRTDINAAPSEGIIRELGGSYR